MNEDNNQQVGGDSNRLQPNSSECGLERKHLRLPSGPDQILSIGIRLLDRYWDRSHVEIGGGTVLAARWHHRHSTDVDCFMSVERFSESYERDLSSMAEALRELKEEGILRDYELHSRTLVMNFAQFGEMSLVAGSRLTPVQETYEYEETTEIRLEPTCEILAKKLAFRVVDGRWKQRDFFDLVVASKCDPKAYEQAMDVLTRREKTAITEILKTRVGSSSLELGEVQDPYDKDVAEATWELAAKLFDGREIELPSLPTAGTKTR